MDFSLLLVCPMKHLRAYLYIIKFIVYLKFKCNSVSCVCLFVCFLVSCVLSASSNTVQDRNDESLRKGARVVQILEIQGERIGQT